MKIFLASYQIVKRSTVAPGPRDEYRKAVSEVLVVVSKPEELASEIAGNVELANGEHVEVVQHRELHPGKKVFVSSGKKSLAR